MVVYSEAFQYWIRLSTETTEAFKGMHKDTLDGAGARLVAVQTRLKSIVDTPYCEGLKDVIQSLDIAVIHNMAPKLQDTRLALTKTKAKLTTTTRRI